MRSETGTVQSGRGPNRTDNGPPKRRKFTQGVESFKTALGALEVLWVTHANACILRHCARVNVTANNLGASHLPDKTRCYNRHAMKVTRLVVAP